jgi:hypothetical protein
MSSIAFEAGRDDERYTCVMKIRYLVPIRPQFYKNYSIGNLYHSRLPASERRNPIRKEGSAPEDSWS